MLTITREFSFDMGHCLPDHGGGCYRPHGHRYRFEVTMDGEKVEVGPERSMLMDFARLKAVVLAAVVWPLDHHFAMSLDDPRLDAAREAFGSGIITFSAPPTAELLAEWIGRKLLDVGVPVVWVTLWETPNCSAGWSPDD